MKKDVIIFSLSANKVLARKVSESLGVELGKSEIEHFSDGEVIARCLSDVEDKTVYIIQSTNAPTTEKIFEILMFVDALKNANAGEINLIIPYYGYSRQDRVAKSGEPVTARVVAGLFESVAIDKLVTIDLHTPHIMDFFKIQVINLDSTEIFIKYFKQIFANKGIKNEDLVIVTPDHGSNTRMEEVARHFDGCSMVYVTKRRPAPNMSSIVSIKGDAKNKYCLLIDDIIDTGGTINHVAEALIENGAKDIFVCATHAIFSHGPLDSRIAQVVVSDTIEKDINGVVTLSSASLIANYIRNDQ